MEGGEGGVRYQRPIYNGNLEIIISSQMWKKISFFLLEKCLTLNFLLISKKCTIYSFANENKQVDYRTI